MSRKKEQERREKEIRLFSAAVFVFLAVKLVLLVPEYQYVEPWSASLYAVDYSNGFVLKGFIGTMMAIVFGNTLSLFKIYIFALANWAILISSITFCVYKLLEKAAEGNALFSAEVLILVYLVHPYSITALMEQINFARPDNFYVTVYFLCVILLCNGRIGSLIAATVLCAVGVAIHPAFVIVCMPSLGIIMLARAFSDEKYGKIRFGLLAVTCVLLATETVYLQFFSPREFIEDVPAFVDRILKEKNYEILYPEELYQEYLVSDTDYISIYLRMITSVFVNSIPSMLILLLPYFVLICAFWVRSVQRPLSVSKNIIPVLCIISVSVSCVSFYYFDYYRWMPETVMCCTVLMLTLYYCRCLEYGGLEFSGWQKCLMLVMLGLGLIMSSSEIKYSFFNKYLEVCRYITEETKAMF